MTAGQLPGARSTARIAFAQLRWLVLVLLMIGATLQLNVYRAQGDDAPIDVAHWRAALLDGTTMPGFHTASTAIPPNNVRSDLGAFTTLAADDRAATGRAEITITLTLASPNETADALTEEARSGRVLERYAGIAGDTLARTGSLGVGDVDQSATFTQPKQGGLFIYATYVDAFLQGRLRGLVEYTAYAPLADPALLRHAATRQVERIRTSGALPAAVTGVTDPVPSLQFTPVTPSLVSAEGGLATLVAAAGAPRASLDQEAVRTSDCWKLAGLPQCSHASVAWHGAAGESVTINLDILQTIVDAQSEFTAHSFQSFGPGEPAVPNIGDAASLNLLGGDSSHGSDGRLVVRRGRALMTVDAKGIPGQGALDQLTSFAQRIDAQVVALDPGDVPLPPVTRKSLPTFAGLAAIALGSNDLPDFPIAEPATDRDMRIDLHDPSELAGYSGGWHQPRRADGSGISVSDELTVFSTPEVAQTEFQPALDLTEDRTFTSTGEDSTQTYFLHPLGSQGVGEASAGEYIQVPAAGAAGGGELYAVIFRRGPLIVSVSVAAEGLTASLEQARGLAQVLDARIGAVLGSSDTGP